jgi:hypothetical protein
MFQQEVLNLYVPPRGKTSRFHSRSSVAIACQAIVHHFSVDDLAKRTGLRRKYLSHIAHRSTRRLAEFVSKVIGHIISKRHFYEIVAAAHCRRDDTTRFNRAVAVLTASPRSRRRIALS